MNFRNGKQLEFSAGIDVVQVTEAVAVKEHFKILLKYFQVYF